MQGWWQRVGVGVGWTLLQVSLAVANQVQDDGFVGSDFLSRLNNSVWGVLIPVLGTIAFLVVIWVLVFSRVIGERLARMAAALVLIGGGAAYIAPRLGLTGIVFGATLPVHVSSPTAPPSDFPALESVLEEGP